MLRKTVAAAMLMLALSLPAAATAADRHPIEIRTEIPFTAEPVYPDNQRADAKGYFHVATSPGQTQQFRVRLTNRKAEPLSLTVRKADAYTSPQGGIVYEAAVDSDDVALSDDAPRMSSLMKAPDAVTLEPNATSEFTFSVTSPSVESGTVLGGIQFAYLSAETGGESPAAGADEVRIGLRSETVVGIAVQLDLPNAATPAFTIGDAGFNPDTGHVFVEMRNDAQLIQRGVSGTYRVERPDGTLLFEGAFPAFNMAPMSRMRYRLPWDSPTLETGTFSISLQVNAGGTPVAVQKDFSVGNSDVGRYVERNPQIAGVQTPTMPAWAWAVVGACLAAVGAVAAFWFLSRRKAKA